jgi:hypothetical protein
MNASKLEILKARQRELSKKIREVAAAQSSADRETDRRRKIIIGGWVLKHRPHLVKELIVNGLERAQDKAAFEGWAPPTLASAAAPPEEN